MFTGASIPECASIEEISFDIDRPEEKTSSERLLQELILETTITKTHDSNDNSILRSEQSNNKNARNRRDTENSIDKHSEYNAIETNDGIDDVNGNALNEQPRGKRFINDVTLANRIYNDFDDMKRAHLLAPFKNKMGLPSKRMKREINMLKNLFDKFELRKPAFNFKTPSLKLSAKGLIPTISTVHDVLTPSADQFKEKQIFEPIDNPDLPTGDVHFELTENLAPSNEYAASFADGNQVVHKFSDGSASVPSSQSLDVYNAGVSASAPIAVSPQTYTYPVAVNNYGELAEADVRPEIVTVTPAPTVAPQPANVQPVQPVQAVHLPYVVKDLPPTWQVNLANMEKARQNLRQNFWPMSMAPATAAQNANTNANVNVVPSPVQSVAPAMAMHIQPDDNVEHVFFESRRRRRRAIDSRMNDEIEERIQNAIEKSTKSEQSARNYRQQSDQVDNEFFEKIARLIDDFEQNRSSMLKNTGLRRRFAMRRSSSLENDVPKKCKVLSMAMEQQCLQSDDSESRPIFKRAAGSTLQRPLSVFKKIVEKVKSNVQTPFKKLREKRSIDYSLNEIDDENLNSIVPKVLKAEDVENTPKKFIHERRYSPKSSLTSTTTQQTRTSKNDAKDAAEQSDQKTEVRKLLRTVNSHVNRFVNSVLGHVGSLWLLS